MVYFGGRRVQDSRKEAPLGKYGLPDMFFYSVFILRSIVPAIRIPRSSYANVLGLQAHDTSARHHMPLLPKGAMKPMCNSRTHAFFGFYAMSRHCIPRLSPRNSNLNTITANNGAAENCSVPAARVTVAAISRPVPSRAVIALSHVRCRLLRSTFAATAPRSAGTPQSLSLSR